MNMIGKSGYGYRDIVRVSEDSFLKSKAAAIDDPGHKAGRSFNLVEDPENLLPGENYRKSPWNSSSHSAVEA